MREIKGKTPISPKAKVWRDFEAYKGTDVNEIARLIGEIYGLTAEEILEEVDIVDLAPLYLDCYKYIIDLYNRKLGTIPNAVSGS